MCRGRTKETPIEQCFELAEAGRSDEQYLGARSTEGLTREEDRGLLPGTVSEPAVGDCVRPMQGGFLEEFAASGVHGGLKFAIYEQVAKCESRAQFEGPLERQKIDVAEQSPERRVLAPIVKERGKHRQRTAKSDELRGSSVPFRGRFVDRLNAIPGQHGGILPRRPARGAGNSVIGPAECGTAGGDRELPMDQQQLSAKLFGSHAANYLTSPAHATGADLERLSVLARTLAAGRALDVGCGAGHASFALARGGVPQIIACDPSAEMLAVVAGEAAARAHPAIEVRQGPAEVLPFEAHAFDLVVTRLSAHHWADVPKALAECARVLKPGGRLVVIDVVVPEAPLLDTAFQVIEFLRDASHVRDYRISEWEAMVRAAGFAGLQVDHWQFRIDFDAWIARIGTPPARVAALKTVFAGLPSEVRQRFEVGPDCSFLSEAAWIEAIAAS
jgi:ubiquinone/menaquinone biosynthesis C-methylase UbiE